MLRVLSNTFWGAGRTALLRIYQALILSRIDYACTVYGTASASNLKRLDTVHHTALRICSGAFRTSPVESLYAVCHQPSLNFRRMQLSLTFYFRVLSSSSNPLRREIIPLSLQRLYDARPSYIPPFNSRMRSLIQTLDFCDIPSQSVNYFLIPPWTISSYYLDCSFVSYSKSNVSPSIFQQLFTFHRHQYIQYIAVFTDGSKFPGHVGCGIVVADITYSYDIPAICSVFTAEAFAILLALRLISSHSVRKFRINSDSLSVLRQLEHALKGNDKADSAARSASSPITLSVPFSDLKNHIRKLFQCLWQHYWDLQGENKLHSVKPTLEPWPAVHMRRADVKLTRLRHTRLTHLHLLFGEPPPKCNDCNVLLTIHHILILSPCFNQLRLTFFSSSILCIKDLLDENHHPNIFAFLRTIAILNSI
nr:uncharacterized protein LOC122272150 [Parasteatoda tepidariorum]